MARVVVCDACVLFPAPLRDLLMRVAVAGLVRAKWTDRILDECFENLARHRPELSTANLERTRRLMNLALEEPLVVGYEPLIDTLTLPDPNDRHVLAAAIHSGAQAVVTWNLKDFPAAALAPHGVVALDPDEFVHDLIELAPGAMVQVVTEQAASLRSPPHTLTELLDKLRNNGLARSVVRLRELTEP
jgi:predicted nucleic acid-binding protein